VQVFEHNQRPSDLVSMECWGVRERVCAVELFIRTGSITETQRGFRRERNQQEAPSLNAKQNSFQATQHCRCFMFILHLSFYASLICSVGFQTPTLTDSCHTQSLLLAD